MNDENKNTKNNTGINTLKKRLLEFAGLNNLSHHETIITNHRHYNELNLTLKEITTIIEGVQQGVSGDFLAINIRQALFHIGNITQKRFKEIWESERYWEVMSYLSSSYFIKVKKNYYK